MLMDPGGGGASFAGISDAVNGIVAATEAGFTISENGGQPLLNAIQDLHEGYARRWVKSSVLGSHPPLGTTPNANVYKPFLATVASDPAQGAIPVLRKLQTVGQRARRDPEVDGRTTRRRIRKRVGVRSSGTWV